MGFRAGPSPLGRKWKAEVGAGRVFSRRPHAAGEFSCPAEVTEERWEGTSDSCAKRRSDAMGDVKPEMNFPQ